MLNGKQINTRINWVQEKLDVGCGFKEKICENMISQWNVLTRNFWLAMSQSKFNSDVSHFTYINKWDHWRGDWRLLSCLLRCFCGFAQLTETLQNNLQRTERKRQFVVYEHDRLTVLFLYYPWLEAGGYFSVDNLNIFAFMTELVLCK